MTWFTPVDTDIANKQPNGAVAWNGARSFLGPLTAPPILIVNKQTGTIEFDVTQDLRSGFQDGWLVRKQDEAAFGNVRFYSKEGAAEAGNANLGPRLILDFGTPSASNNSSTGGSRLLAFLRPGQFQASLSATEHDPEVGSLREFLRKEPAAVFVSERVLLSAVAPNPLAEFGLRFAYRTWLRGEPAIV